MEPKPIVFPVASRLREAPVPAQTRFRVQPLLTSPLQRRQGRWLKRVVDFGISSVLILLIFPWFLPIAAIAIRLNSAGPVFFRQRRHKKGGREFYCLKLRTMIANEEADTLAAFEGDTRITSVGRFLRRTHLDELPQLINVWLGEMSLIGPRPHMLRENEDFAELLGNYGQRHQVKPGITGLAQVRGFVGATRDEEAIRLRVACDLHYIRNWSPGLDARILRDTLLQLLRRFNREAA